MNRSIIIAKAYHWHRRLNWLGGIALLWFILSGLTHPLMLYTSPPPARFFPPQATMQAGYVQAIPIILQNHKIKKAAQIKLVPFQEEMLLQITEKADVPRRYFSLATKEELPQFDREYAIWLARYYTGQWDAAITEVTWQTKFDTAYPWVNRLLPVYQVHLDTPDSQEVFIYTELSALANYTNDWKRSLQAVFQGMHTASWLDSAETLRLVLLSLLLFSLLSAIMTGASLLILMKKRRIADNHRKWHRRLGWVIWLPLMLMSVSGMYHLWHYAYDNAPERGLVMLPPFSIDAEHLTQHFPSLATWADIPVNALSLVKGEGDARYYRLSIPQDKPDAWISLQQRFDGIAAESGAIYLDAYTGEIAEMDDETIARLYAIQHTGLDVTRITDATLKTQFDAGYDFRNKRLPVWQFALATPEKTHVFIDSATGALVDNVTARQRLEGMSFSILHKWNILVPLIGREGRDIAQVGILLLAISTAMLGYALWWKRRHKG